MAIIRFCIDWLRLSAFVALSSLCLLTSASAHEIRPAIANVTIGAEALSMDVDLVVEGVLAGIDATAYADTNDAPQAAEYDRLRALSVDDLRTEVRSNWDRLAALFVFATDGDTPAPVLDAIEVMDPGDPELPRDTRLTLTVALPPGSAPVEVGIAREVGELILRHQGAGEDAFAGLLSPGELSPPLPRQGGAAESAGATFARYVVLGVEHIVPKGLDHILFVLGLFFFSLKMRPLLTQVTAFTLAHTVTLALAAAGVVAVSPAIVEPLIAASIVYVAVENIRGGALSRTRTAVVFGFGLLHGLGFAGVLGEIGLPQGQFLVSLIGFNIGVEIGQLIVILAAFLIVGLWFGKRDFYRPWIAVPASVVIALVGAWWVVERIFL